jgi:hypothetical protein
MIEQVALKDHVGEFGDRQVRSLMMNDKMQELWCRGTRAVEVG